MTSRCPISSYRVSRPRHSSLAAQTRSKESECLPHELGERGAAVTGAPAGDGGSQGGHGGAADEHRIDVRARLPVGPTRDVLDEGALHRVVGGEMPGGERWDLPHEPEPEQPLLPTDGQLIETLE